MAYKSSMKRQTNLINFLFYIMFCCTITAQTTTGQLEESLKNDSNTYGELSPETDRLFFLSDIGYTAEKALEENVFVEQDSVIDIFTVLWFYEKKIFASIDTLLQHCTLKEISDYGYDNITMLLSDDERFLNVSISEKAGGTWHGRISKSYYRSEEGELYDVSGISRDGIASIYTINTKEATKYLFLEHTISCASCNIFKAHLVSFSEGTYQSDFEYEMQTRLGNYELDYDEKHQTLRINYHTDDFQSYCDCNENTWDGRNYVEWNDTIEHCSCMFQFDGTTFQLIDNTQK